MYPFYFFFLLFYFCFIFYKITKKSLQIEGKKTFHFFCFVFSKKVFKKNSNYRNSTKKKYAESKEIHNWPSSRDRCNFIKRIRRSRSAKNSWVPRSEFLTRHGFATSGRRDGNTPSDENIAIPRRPGRWRRMDGCPVALRFRLGHFLIFFVIVSRSDKRQWLGVYSPASSVASRQRFSSFFECRLWNLPRRTVENVWSHE